MTSSDDLGVILCNTLLSFVKFEVIEKMLKNNPEIIHYNNEEPLRIVFALGQYDFAHYFVKNNNANLCNAINQMIKNEISSDRKYHIMIWASKYGYLDAIKLLIENGINPIKGEYNELLQNAAENGCLDIVKYAIETLKNATQNHKNRALLSARVKARLLVCRYLIEHGAVC